MTKEMKRLIGLVDLNGKAKQLCDDFAAEQTPTSQDIAALMRQIGDQVALAVGMMVKARAQREAAVERFEVES